MTNYNDSQDPNMLTFKPNNPLSSIGTLTFGSNLKEDLNLPLTKNSKPISIQNHPYQPLISSYSEPLHLSHESYIDTILLLLMSIPQLTHKICSKAYSNDDSKAKLLYELKTFFTSYGKTKPLRSDSLQLLLSRLFKPQGKFVLMYPDSPIDVYFALINSIHNYSIASLSLYNKLIASESK